MSWQAFLKVYVPTLIAAVFVVAFTGSHGGWAQLTGGYTGGKGLVALFGSLLGIVVPLVVFSFGVGAVIWLIAYPLSAERPSYLSYVKNTLLVFAAFLLIGGIYGTFQNEASDSSLEDKKLSNEDKRTPNEDIGNRNITEENEIIIDERKNERIVQTWRETALWKMTVQQEVMKWIKRGETIRVVEDEGSHYKVEHNGDVGYIRKENLKPEDR